MENSTNAIIALLGVIAAGSVVIGIWIINISIVFDNHLRELRISLNELHMRWIDVFDVEEGGDDA